MRIFISTSLLIAYLVLMLKPSLPLVEYGMRQDFIAKELCVDSDIPDSGCNGSCYLNKRLKEAAGEQDPTSEVQEEIIVPVHLFHSVTIQFNAPAQPSWQSGKFIIPRQTLTSPPVPPPEMFS